MPSPPLVIRRLGLVEYEDGLRMQEALGERIREGSSPDHLLLLEHPHVLTMGRRGGWENLVAPEAMLAELGVELHETDRGGDITYHGPGQVVGYPLITLPEGRRDVRRYVGSVEQLLISACADFGVTTEPGGPGRTGVWAPEGKVGSIGVRIHRWVTSHGFALNVETDLSFFGLIIPCGLAGEPVTSLAQLAPGSPAPPPSVGAVVDRLVARVGDALDREAQEVPIERDSVQVIVHRRSAGGARQILVLNRTEERGGFRQPVTGLLEAGEDPRAAAAREVQEETGLPCRPEDLRDLDYTHSFLIERWTRPDNPDAPGFCREHSFAWEAPAAAEVRIEPREHTAAAWLAPEVAVEAMRWKGNIRAIRLVAGAI